MSPKNTVKSGDSSFTDFKMRRWLTDWLQKTTEKLGTGWPLHGKSGDSKIFSASVMGDFALLQAGRIERMLAESFGLVHGFAAPEVVVLDLYPQGVLASVEAVRSACAELVAAMPGISVEKAVGLIEGRFWTLTDGGLVAVNEAAAIDLEQMIRQEIAFHQETQRIFDPPAFPEDVLHKLDAENAAHPVLVVMGLFPPVESTVYDRHAKPFTRHDESMYVFNFVEEILTACGRGVASVMAPPALCEAVEAAGMRKRWLKLFDRVYVDAMKDSALYQLVKLPRTKEWRGKRGEAATVLYKYDPNTPPLDVLVGSSPGVAKAIDAGYRIAAPSAVNKYSFVPVPVSNEYLAWASIVDLPCAEPVNGLMEKRGGALIDVDRDALEKRMRAYLDPQLSWGKYKTLGYGLTERQSNFDPEAARDAMRISVEFQKRDIRPYTFKPFDNRYCYYSPTTSLWNDPRPELARQCQRGNRFLITRPAAAVESEGVPFFLTSALPDGDLLRGHAYCIPLCLFGEREGSAAQPNLTRGVLDYFRILGLADGNSEWLAETVWHHVLAIGFSPTYLASNQAALQLDWPRIPFPMPDGNDEEGVAKARSLLLESAGLGELVADLLDGNATADGRSLLSLASLTSLEQPNGMTNDSITPIALTAHWGYEKVRRKEAGQGSSINIMPGNGRLYRRNYTPGERREIEGWGLEQGLHAGAVYAALGCETYDVFLNRDVYWRNVPANVWEYRIGGYPVLKKWLSYREHSILKRKLRPDEIQFFVEIVWRLASLRLLESRLDRNFAQIRDCGGDPTKLPSKTPKNELF